MRDQKIASAKIRPTDKGPVAVVTLTLDVEAVIFYMENMPKNDTEYVFYSSLLYEMTNGPHDPR